MTVVVPTEKPRAFDPSGFPQIVSALYADEVPEDPNQWPGVLFSIAVGSVDPDERLALEFFQFDAPDGGPGSPEEFVAEREAELRAILGIA